MQYLLPLFELIHHLDKPFVFIFIILISALTAGIVRRQYALGLFLAVALSFAVTHILKHIFAVPRPDDMLLVANGYRFPSLHAAVTTSIAVSLALYGTEFVRTTRFPDQLRWAFILAALAVILIVDVSRIALNVHKPIDVIVGSVIGGSISYAVYRFIVVAHRK